MPRKSIYRTEYRAVVRLLRSVRLASGLTQAQMATALERPQSYVSDVERGVRRLDLLQLREYCLACGTSLPAFVKKLEASLK